VSYREWRDRYTKRERKRKREREREREREIKGKGELSEPRCDIKKSNKIFSDFLLSLSARTEDKVDTFWKAPPTFKSLTILIEQKNLLKIKDGKA
jgi:hypothetical protein